MTMLPLRTTTTGRSDRGSSVLVVLATMTILIAMVSVGLSQAVNSMRHIDQASDWKEALVAAEAGVDDYLARLNLNDNYWRAADCTNLAMKGDPADTLVVPSYVSSCGWRAGTPLGWRSVIGSDNAEFHYDVDVSETAIDGTVKVVSTGRVNNQTRTIQVLLRRGGFGEFLYYTVYETTDPANEATYGYNNTTAAAACPRYYWADPPRGEYTYGGRDYTFSCNDINFVTGDRINGPMHTNDAMLVRGGDSPRFLGTVTTSYPNCRPGASGAPRPASSCYRGSASPVFSKGIGYREEIELPTSIGDLRQYVTAGSVPSDRLGCLYTGPTRILFLPTSGSGTPKMRVWSKWTTSVNPGCGTVGTGSNRLGSSGGQEVDVPHNKVLMVQNVPTGQAMPSNFCVKDSSNRETSVIADGAVGDGLPVPSDFNSTLIENSCRYGTAYVEGTLKGRVTLAADNNIVVTGDTFFQGGDNGTDALGMIAENSVKIYHPVQRGSCAQSSGGTCVRYNWTNLERNGSPRRAVLTNVTLNAAVLTLQHSFGIQLYQHGAKLGTLKIFGSLAQRFRGPVGTTGSPGTGYLKDYNYDTKLRYSPPPYFLDPVRSGWGQKVFGEIEPRYGS